MLKALVAGALGFAFVSRPVAAQSCTTDTDCDTGYKCCPAGFCLVDTDTCCGGGYCPAGEACCGDTNCCPNDGYTCAGTACCETCDRRPGQCGEVQVFCGDTPTLISCPTPQGSVCCNGLSHVGDCCASDECGGVPTGSCGEMLCLDHRCTLSGSCQQGHECCDGACCDEDQYCCGDMCQDAPCDAKGCKADKDCKHGCCCKEGDCSHACCSDSGDKDENTPEGGGGSVVINTLPNTGAGTSPEGASMLGAVALLAGAVAAAGARLRRPGKHPHRA